MLTIQSLCKSYPTSQGAVEVLRGVNLELEEGGSLALMGESGSGKSTLLHLVAGLDRPDSGEIRLDGTSLATLGESRLAAWRRSEIGLVFQQFNLISSLTVEHNLAFQARLAGRYDPHWHAQLVDRLGLGDLLGRYPEQLSVGQQQRLALGRALAARPRLLLADEPTGNLDETTAEQVLELLLELLGESRTTLFMVTHSPQVAGRLQRCLILQGGRLREP